MIFSLEKKIYNIRSLNFLQNLNLSVGLLGGSFNPPHIGHINLSLKGVKSMKLDLVIWLVAMQNSFKPKYAASIFQRAHNSLALISSNRGCNRLLVSTIEYDLQTSRTSEVISYLAHKYPNIKFTWMMGADNMEHFLKWERFDVILRVCDRVAIFDRKTYSNYIHNSKFSIFTKHKIKNKIIIDKTFKMNISSTQIRNRFISIT